MQLTISAGEKDYLNKFRIRFTRDNHRVQISRYDFHYQLSTINYQYLHFHYFIFFVLAEFADLVYELIG